MGLVILANALDGENNATRNIKPCRTGSIPTLCAEYNVLTGKDLRRIIVVAEGLIFLAATRGQTEPVSFTTIKPCLEDLRTSVESSAARSEPGQAVSARLTTLPPG